VLRHPAFSKLLSSCIRAGLAFGALLLFAKLFPRFWLFDEAESTNSNCVSPT
jgi:hypothetical protein